MKTGIITTAAVMGLVVALCAGEVLAAGNGKGRGGSGSSVSANTTTTRPVGSQRRDGTFLTTGTTANGSATRPGKGKGVMDGSGLPSISTSASTTIANTTTIPTAP